MSDITRFIKLLFRHWWIIVISVIIAYTFASRYIRYAVPTYESTSKIKLAEINEGPASSNLFKNFDVFANTNKIGTEVEVLKSKVLVERLIDSLKLRNEYFRLGTIKTTELYNESPFIAQYLPNKEYKSDLHFNIKIISENKFEIITPDSSDIITTEFGKIINTSKGKILVVKNEALFQQKDKVALIDNYEFVYRALPKLLSDITEKIDVVPIDKDVPVLRINFISHVPQKSADIVNTLAKIYVTDYIDAKVKAANTTVQFLNSQIDTLNRRLTNSQDNIEDYRIKENIINTQQETETDLRKISQLKIQSSNLRMQLDAVSKLYAYLVDSDEKTFLNQAPNFEAFNDLLSTEIVKNIKDLQIKRHDLLLEYTPYDEKVKIIDVKIREYRNYLIESVKNSLDNYKTKYERLTDEIYAAQSSFVGLPEKEKNMNILQRSFTLNEQTYNFLQQKHTEAEIAREAAISFHRIIQYGEVNNEPVTPKKGLLKILAIVLGLAIGMLIVFVLHSLHGRVEDETHIETLSETELLGKIPFITSDENAITVFDELTMELQLKKILQIGTIISINSFEKGDGKSFIARLLSKSLIKSGWDVVVIVPDLIASKPTYVTEDGIKCFVTPATDKICNFINECKIQNPNSVFILKNLQISKSKAGILAMGCCQTNLFLFDTQQSNLRRIEQANLLQDEYKFNNFYFIINRFGHHKNLKDWAVFFTQWIKKYILRIND